jgi:hypothetical protein
MATKTETRSTTDRQGVVSGDVADRGQSTAVAVLKDTITELRPIADEGIDFAEKCAAALFRLARKITQRVDEGSGETLTAAERMILGAVKSVRETAKAATDTATTAPSE